MALGKTDPFVITVHNHTKVGCEGEYLKLLEGVLDEMRKEPTFINTILHKDPDDPTDFYLYETWIDRDEFFENQLKKPYRMEYERRLESLLRKPREMKVWEPLRGDYVFQNGPRQTQQK